MIRTKRQIGFTLVELIVVLVVLGVGASSFVVLINQATKASVDPLIRVQANAVAQSYLEEILLQPFCDDPGGDCSGCVSSPCAACSTATGSRPLYDDVFDYAGLNQQPTDRNNNVLGLGNYNVVVSIQDNGVGLGGLSGNSCQVARVDVDVTHTPTSTSMTLSGYKVNF
ncbi:MAG: prepilin-type N-terminal cleavage/methylation domain-containing protein [Gammaproteobacteria bacterium]